MRVEGGGGGGEERNGEEVRSQESKGEGWDESEYRRMGEGRRRRFGGEEEWRGEEDKRGGVESDRGGRGGRAEQDSSPSSSTNIDEHEVGSRFGSSRHVSASDSIASHSI